MYGQCVNIAMSSLLSTELLKMRFRLFAADPPKLTTMLSSDKLLCTFCDTVSG